MTNGQFWIQTWIQIISAGAAIAVAVLAIWGQAIRSRLVGPKLTLRLLDPEGERIDLGDSTPSRWYHLQVTNQRRSSHAKNVRVVLVSMSRPAADGTIHANALSGPIQLTWQHGHSLPQYPTLGPPMNADLGFVIRNGVFRITPIFVPNNLNVQVAPGERVIVEIMALSDETESKPVAIEIAWNGTWSEDAASMKRNLVVKQI